MRFTVIWTAVALELLADLWISAPDREAVTEAVEEVDRWLSEDPESKGEEFYGDRLLVVSPVYVTYRVEEADRIVEIIDIWR
jgi:hypothetical protein